MKKFILSTVICLFSATSSFAAITWSYDDSAGKVTISGSGDMENYIKGGTSETYRYTDEGTVWQVYVTHLKKGVEKFNFTPSMDLWFISVNYAIDE